jgi:SET domain-containing protein
MNSEVQPAVEVRASPKGGLGVFALKAFAEGEFIRERLIVQEITPEHPLPPDEDPAHAYQADGKWLLVGEPDRYLNHSCDPNAWLRYSADRIELIARRPIRPGDEITLDYLINNSGGNSWPCHCGAARCRGETGSGFFMLPPEVQHEYRPLLAEWFIRLHRQKLAGLPGLNKTDV